MTEPTPQKSGIPRWLLWAFAGKLVLVTAITLAVVWYVSL